MLSRSQSKALVRMGHGRALYVRLGVAKGAVHACPSDPELLGIPRVNPFKSRISRIIVLREMPN